MRCCKHTLPVSKCYAVTTDPGGESSRKSNVRPAKCDMQSRATRDDYFRPVNPLIYIDRRPAVRLTLRYSGRSPNMADDHRHGQTTEDHHQRRGFESVGRVTTVACRRLRVHLVVAIVSGCTNEFSLWSTRRCMACSVRLYREHSCRRSRGFTSRPRPI